MKKKLYEYELVVLDKHEDDEEATTPRKYYFRNETAKEHNRQYAFNDVPRRLVKVEGGEVIETPYWWSGDLTRFKKNHKFEK